MMEVNKISQEVGSHNHKHLQELQEENASLLHNLGDFFRGKFIEK